MATFFIWTGLISIALSLSFVIGVIVWLLQRWETRANNKFFKDIKGFDVETQRSLRFRPLVFVLGCIEIIVTAFLTQHIAAVGLNQYEILTIGGAYVGGWIAIKVLPHSMGGQEKIKTGLYDSGIRQTFIIGTLLGLLNCKCPADSQATNARKNPLLPRQVAYRTPL